MKPILILSLALLVAGCAKDKRPPIVWTPTNPDLPAVIEPVKVAKATAVKASDSAARAVQIVEKIVPSPGQEKMIETLRLELATTVEQLRLTSEQLDTALLRIPTLQNQVEDMKAWGLEQNRMLQASVKETDKQKAAAEKFRHEAIVSGFERDAFILLFSVIATLAVIKALQGYFWKFPNPLWAALTYLAATATTFSLSFFVIRTFVSFLVRTFIV